MTRSRLPALLAALALLLALRVGSPPASNETAPAAAVLRPVPWAAAAPAPSMPAPALASAQVDSGDERSAVEPIDVPGNAFAVRVVAPAPMVVAPAQAPVAVAVAVPRPAPPPLASVAPAEAMPPLQVIGTYDDGQAPAVFIATPIGTRIARPGTTLLAQYRVAGIASGRVSLVQLSNGRSFELAAPAPSRP